ncbi:hypothetical protein [Rhodanobacter lindaniclasticus]|uniref:Phage protein D n=1 Tax=Rhodanobacter lindaniclasticus TaxID=75310 RepID=A0A4V3USD4_9GAMM|nr:hypothetical protein [Rhodanobacter lindaniclasticus]THD06291.1 hypothetical protein B1991_13825 [Rhodanobacter lindaniclasticus]
MLEGVHLTLLVGPVVPVPVPQFVLDALTQVEVSVPDEGAGAFTLQFALSVRSPLHTLFLLSGGGVVPLLRVIVVATVSGMPQVLIDGVVTKTEVLPGADQRHTTLQVTGDDLTTVMTKLEFSGLQGLPYPAMPAEAIVALLLAKYAFLGIVPLVIPSIAIDVPIPTNRIPTQQGNDLEYIRLLAERVGYVFYLDPGPAPGMSIAYWGPKVKVGVPQPALNADMDAASNVDELSFSYHGNARQLPVVYIQNEQTKVPLPIPIPDVGPLNPPLGLVDPPPQQFRPLPETAKYSPQRAMLLGMAEAAKSADTVTGKGSLDVVRYGRVLKSRQLVGVRGVGPAFDGLHYVSQVRHTIRRGEYKQSFELSRKGLISAVPLVLP